MDYPEFAARASPQHGSFQGLVDYNLIPSSNPESQQTPRHLLVFVNGLMLPQTGWFPAMLEVLDKSRASSLPPVAMLSYDRPGQGQSGPHPKDAGLQPEHRHDCGDAANELADLIEHVLTLPDLPKSLNTSIVLICNSIGCPIARLYATQHLASLAGLVFLDSNVTNTDFVSCWPDPDEPDFDPSTLPEDVDANDLRMTRAKFRKVFHPSVPNPEGISRRNLPDLIPHGDRPVLYASDNNGPFLVVMGHDPQTFAEQSWTGSLQIPIAHTMHYLNPLWHDYNIALTQIAHPSRTKGPIIASGCGHFIQKDDHHLVANTIVETLQNITNST